ncbi:heat stress transcription factor A-3 [Euphorbia lathyris]|uniref:heat stress transcription factor A-3 n=1 Tax=Euphorbia lathyris TaxID=212925 RepID=UPI003313B211
MDQEAENSPKSPHEITSSGMFPSSFEFEEFSSEMFEFKANPISDEGEENIGVPRPLASLHENPIPPFLSKTYDLVNDRSLDPIISWSSGGESFVVWDLVEFSRIVLPRNFKHNNFSSFVRQLNTYGFRKIDSDKWEFANEGFRRGERHLLKNIQRRRPLQSQQTVSYTGPSVKSELESEIETLMKERGEMMQEVVELQQQQRGAVHHMEAVNQRLQAAEQRQKQMISFLANLFQNPAFLARLKQNKEQREIGSPRMKRKFVKHHLNEPVELESPMEGKIVKYTPGHFSPIVPDINAVQGIPGMDEEAEGMKYRIESVQPDEFPAQFGEGTSNLLREDPRYKGKSLMNPLQEVGPEYFVSSSMDLATVKDFPEFSSAGIGSIVEQEDLWNMGFESQTGMSNTSQEMWANVVNYNMPELGTSGGFSDIWDLSSLQAAGSSGTMWLSDESPIDEPESHSGQTNDEK